MVLMRGGKPTQKYIDARDRGSSRVEPHCRIWFWLGADSASHRQLLIGCETHRCYTAPFIMSETKTRSSTRELYVYFSLLALLVNITSPQWVLDIPTSYMLKDILHASAAQVSLFRIITGIPFFAGFIFGLIRDSWNPFGWRDPGYFRIFVPLTVITLVGGAFSRTTYTGPALGCSPPPSPTALWPQRFRDCLRS